MPPWPWPSSTSATSRSPCCWATTSSPRRQAAAGHDRASTSRYGRSVIAVMEVPRADIHLYGCDRAGVRRGRTSRGSSEIVEKPTSPRSPVEPGRDRPLRLHPRDLRRPAGDDPGQGRRGPADRRHQPAGPAADGLRARVRGPPLRHREEARLPAGDGGAGHRPRGPRSRVPGASSPTSSSERSSSGEPWRAPHHDHGGGEHAVRRRGPGARSSSGSARSPRSSSISRRRWAASWRPTWWPRWTSRPSPPRPWTGSRCGPRTSSEPPRTNR